MCIGDVTAEGHKCVNACPVCHIFTLENTLKLLSGESISLGDVDLFVQVGQLGCRMCAMLCSMWGTQEEVR